MLYNIITAAGPHSFPKLSKPNRSTYIYAHNATDGILYYILSHAAAVDCAEFCKHDECATPLVSVGGDRVRTRSLRHISLSRRVCVCVYLHCRRAYYPISTKPYLICVVARRQRLRVYITSCTRQCALVYLF